MGATKDVQDAILNDAERKSIVDLIDIKYWHYRDDGSAYAPKGGENLAPRQHARKMKTGKETEEQVYRAVREYREKFPEKVVTYSTNAAPRFGWAVLMAGGSLANIPEIDLPEFYQDLSAMKPSNKSYQDDVWALKNNNGSLLFYLKKADNVDVDLSGFNGKYEGYWINASNGKLLSTIQLKGDSTTTATSPNGKKAILYIQKKN